MNNYMAEIILPDDFSPLFRDVIYKINRGEGGKTPYDVEVLGPDEDLIGVKRFADAGEIDMNIAGYLKQAYFPEPVGNGGCALLKDLGRSVRASLRIGGEDCDGRVFAGSEERLEAGKLLSKMACRRSLGQGEYDELSFAVGKGTVSVIVEAEGRQPFSFTVDCTANKEIVTFRLDADNIALRADASGSSFRELEYVSVTVYLEGRRIARVYYDIIKGARPGVRIAWLNSLGGVDYYTFDLLNSETVKVSRQGYISDKGYRGVSLKKEKILEVTGGYLNRAMSEALSEVISSRYVWMVNDSRANPLEVVSDSVVIRSDSLECMKLLLKLHNAG